MNAFKRLLPCLAVGMTLGTPAAYAAEVSNAVIYLGNYLSEEASYYLSDAASDYKWEGGLADTGEYTAIFSGLNAYGDAAEGSISAQAKAWAGQGALKTYASLSVTNPLVNPSNTPYVANNNFDTNPDGIPDYYAASATAYYSDAVTLSAGSTISYVTLSLTLDGNFNLPSYEEGQSASLYTALRQNDGSSPWAWPSDNLAYLYGTISDYAVITTPIEVIDNSFSFGLMLESWASVISYDNPWMEGQTFSGTIDFMNTVVISGLQAFDADNNPVNILSAVGSSGYTYVAAVPEPETYAMLLAGLGLVGFVAKRRKSQQLAN